MRATSVRSWHKTGVFYSPITYWHVISKQKNSTNSSVAETSDHNNCFAPFFSQTSWEQRDRLFPNQHHHSQAGRYRHCPSQTTPPTPLSDHTATARPTPKPPNVAPPTWVWRLWVWTLPAPSRPENATNAWFGTRRHSQAKLNTTERCSSNVGLDTAGTAQAWTRCQCLCQTTPPRHQMLLLQRGSAALPPTVL